eukprot:gene5396-7394_t
MRRLCSIASAPDARDVGGSPTQLEVVVGPLWYNTEELLRESLDQLHDDAGVVGRTRSQFLRSDTAQDLLHDIPELGAGARRKRCRTVAAAPPGAAARRAAAADGRGAVAKTPPSTAGCAASKLRRGVRDSGRVFGQALG